MTDDFSHDFNCEAACMLCVKCGMHLREALDSGAACGARVRHHPHPLPESTGVPYVPEWAVPLARARD